MLLNLNGDSFGADRDGICVHFVHQIRRKNAAYAIQILSLLVSLILSLVVAISQQTAVQSLRFLVATTLVMVLHACFIIFTENYYDVRCQCTSEYHSIRSFTLMDKPCSCFATTVPTTINMLNTFGCLFSLWYLLVLKIYATGDFFVSVYALLSSYLIASFPAVVGRQGYLHRGVRTGTFLIFMFALVKVLNGSTLLILLISIFLITIVSSRFSFEQLNRRPLQLIMDSQALQLLSKQFIAKTFANLLPHRALDYIFQDKDIKLQVHADMYLLVINIDIPCLRKKLQKYMYAATNTHTKPASNNISFSPLTDCYINHIIASVVNQFISCIDTILLDDFPQLTKVYSNLSTIKVIAGNSFTQYNNRQNPQDIEFGAKNVEPKDYMKILSTFALLVSRCAGIFALRVDSVITFGDLAIGFLGSQHMSCYEVFGAPVALATKLHEKIVTYNQETTRQSDSGAASNTQSYESDRDWSRSTTSTNSDSFVSSNHNAAATDDTRDRPYGHSSKTPSTKCSLSLSKDSLLSSHDHVPLYLDIARSSLDNEPIHSVANGIKTGAGLKANLFSASNMSFSQAYHSVAEPTVEFNELPSNVYFSVVNMLSRPLEEYGNRGTEGSDTITSDVICSDAFSDDPQPLTNADLESSMNFRRFLAARRGNTRSAIYSRRRSVIKALNTTTSPTDDAFPQKLISLHQNPDSSVSIHSKHRLRSHSSTTPQTMPLNSTFFYSSSSTNSMRLWSPKNLKIDAIYVNNALSQLTYPYSTKTPSPNFQEVCDMKVSVFQVSLDGLSTTPLSIEYPSRITHKYRNFLFYKPPLYMFYDSIKLTLPGSSLSSNSSTSSSSHHSLGILSFTNHNYSLIVCLLAFGIKHRILVSEQNAATKASLGEHRDIDLKEYPSLSINKSIDTSIGETLTSSQTTHDTFSLSECTDTMVSNASMQKGDGSPKCEYWDADSSYQLLLQTEDLILRAKDPKSSGYRALRMLDSIPIYNSKAMRKLFRLLNTDLERFDKVITSLNKSLLPQGNVVGDLGTLAHNQFDFDSLVANAGLHKKRQPNAEWPSFLKEVKMAMIKPMDNTAEFHSYRDHDSSQFSSFIYPFSGDPTLLTTSSDSHGTPLTTPVFESANPENPISMIMSSNVLSAQNFSDSRLTNLYTHKSQLLPSSVMAPENLPIPGHQALLKSKVSDPNLKTLMTIVTRKTESFDSSSMNVDNVLPVHYFKRRAYSYVDFSANKLDILYSKIGRRSTARLGTANHSLSENNQTSGKLTDCLRNLQINELKAFSRSLDKRLRSKNASQHKANPEFKLSNANSNSAKFSLHSHADEEVEIPLLTPKSPSIEYSSTNDSCTESLPETPKSVASHLPIHRSALSHLCQSISPSSDIDSKSDNTYGQNKDISPPNCSFIKVSKTFVAALQESDDSMHTLSLVRESDQSASTDDASDIQFNKTSTSQLNNPTDRAFSRTSGASAYPLPAGPSTYPKTGALNPPNFSGSMPTDGTSNPPTTLDSYSCLYKLEIASENDETENSVQSVILFNGSMHLPDNSAQDTAPASMLSQFRGNKSTMGGNPRPMVYQAPDTLDGTVSSLSITSCTDSPQNKSKAASYKPSSCTDGMDDDPLLNPIIWQTNSFITLGKPATEKLSTSATGRSIETSFHAITSHALKDIVTTRPAPTPAYTPINLSNINQYKSIVYTTFGVAFDLVARPSIYASSMPGIRPICSSSSLRGGPSSNSKHDYEDAAFKAKAGSTTEEDQCSSDRQDANSDAVQESLLQTRKRHSKFLHSNWQSMIYLKRCSLNAALSYIQLSDTTEDEELCKTSEPQLPIETGRLRPHTSALEVDTEIPEDSSARNFFACARLKKIYTGELEQPQRSISKPRGWLRYSTSAFKWPLFKPFLRPLTCKPILEEHVSFLITLTSGYLLRIFFDILFYVIFLFMLFGAHEITDTNQHIYLLYIYGRLLTFRNPCQRKQLSTRLISDTFQGSSSLVPFVMKCNFSFSNLVHVTRLDSNGSGLASVLLQNHAQLHHFHAFMSTLLGLRILLTLFRALIASRKSKLVVSTKTVLFGRVMKEHPILYRLVQITRCVTVAVDAVSSSMLILTRTFVLYEYFRGLRDFTTSNFVFFFFLIITTWSSITTELSPLCNTSTGATVSLCTHIWANTIFLLDATNYFAPVLRIFTELKCVYLAISYYISNILQKMEPTYNVSNSANIGSYLQTEHIRGTDYPTLTICVSLLSDLRLGTPLKAIWNAYHTIRKNFPKHNSSLIAYLSCAFSKAGLRSLRPVTCQTLDDALVLAHESPSMRNLHSAIYFLSIILCIVRVLFGQLDLYHAMLNHVAQGISTYSETKKAIGVIACNKLERIFFDCYLHNTFSSCNVLTYQAEHLHRGINMDRNPAYMGKQLKLVGMVSDLIYDTEVQLPYATTECLAGGPLKQKARLPLMVLRLLQARIASILSKRGRDQGSEAEHKLTTVTGKTTKRSVRHLRSPSVPRRAAVSATPPDKKITSVTSFANMHDCYDIAKSLESLLKERFGDSSAQFSRVYSDEELHQIVRRSKFSSWRKYALFRSCYNSCNFTFRYLYDLDTLRLILASKFSMKICDENMYPLKPDTVFEPYYSKTLAGVLRALLVYNDRRFNSMPSPFLFISPSYMLCITITELYDAIVEEGAHITLLKYMTLLKIINDTVVRDSNLLYVQKDFSFYIIYNTAHLSQFSSIHKISDPMDCYVAIFYLCKIAYSIRKSFLWELEKRFYTQTFKVFGYINLHHELNLCLVGRRLNRLDILDTTALHERVRSMSLICGPFDVVLQDELYKVAKEVYRMSASTRRMLNIEIDETGIYKKLLNITEGI